MVLLNVAGLVGEGETEGAKAELITIMAKTGSANVTATSAISDMAGFSYRQRLVPRLPADADNQGHL